MVGVNGKRWFVLLVLRERGRGTAYGDERIGVESMGNRTPNRQIHHKCTREGDNADEREEDTYFRS